MKKIKMGMIGGGTGAFIGDAHRRASRICNAFELIGGVFSSDYNKGVDFVKNEGLATGRCYKTVDDLIKGELKLDPEIRMEVITIVTPNALHFKAARDL